MCPAAQTGSACNLEWKINNQGELPVLAILLDFLCRNIRAVSDFLSRSNPTKMDASPGLASISWYSYQQPQPLPQLLQPQPLLPQLPEQPLPPQFPLPLPHPHRMTIKMMIHSQLQPPQLLLLHHIRLPPEGQDRERVALLSSTSYALVVFGVWSYR